MSNQESITDPDAPTHGIPSSESVEEGEPASESESDSRPFSDMDVITMRDLLEVEGRLDSSSDGDSS